MSQIIWDAPGDRVYETGIDRGVLYVGTQPGVPWNGLTSVEQAPSGGTPTPYYIDGEKYLNVPAIEEFAATVNAFTYPEEFEVCDGTVDAGQGLLVTSQSRIPFNLSYRSMVGNDQGGLTYGYKIHLIYNALANPSNRSYASINDTVSPVAFSWGVTTQAPILPGFRSSAHIVIDTTDADPGAVAAVESILYGTSTTDPRMPFIDELTDVMGYFTNILAVIDTFSGSSLSNPPWTILFGGSRMIESGGRLAITANASYARAESTPSYDLSVGILAVRYTDVEAGETFNTQVMFGAHDGSENTIRFTALPHDGSWAWHVEGATTLGAVTGPFTGIGAMWEAGDFIGIGNIGSDNIVHLYQSKQGGVWNQIGTAVIGGTFGKTACGIVLEVGVANSDTSTYVAYFDDASYFIAPAS